MALDRDGKHVYLRSHGGCPNVWRPGADRVIGCVLYFSKLRTVARAGLKLLPRLLSMMRLTKLF